MPRASSVLCLELNFEQSHEEVTQAVMEVTETTPQAVTCHGKPNHLFKSIPCLSSY